MSNAVRVMVERGKKKRSVACAFDWPGWDRSGKTEGAALLALDEYRPRFAAVAAIAGLADDLAAAGDLEVVERLPGIGMTDFYGVSGVPAGPEHDQMSDTECERKVALLKASWTYFDGVAARVSPELRKGPRGGGRERDQIIRHTVGWEIYDLARKVGVTFDPEICQNPTALRTYRAAFADAIRDHNARGVTARTWTVQFLIRRCAWHMLDHAWEMEDRDLSPG